MLLQTLHWHGVADSLAVWLPAGLAGGVGMLRNWLFTLFYCMSELWGDVVLSLLFWGLANETTALHDASLLYPLFGIGANMGQVGPACSISAYIWSQMGGVSWVGGYITGCRDAQAQYGVTQRNGVRAH